MATRGRLSLPAYIRAFALAGIAGARRGGPVAHRHQRRARETHQRQPGTNIVLLLAARLIGRALASPWAVAICAAIRRVVGRVAGRRECGARSTPTCARRPHDARVSAIPDGTARGSPAPCKPSMSAATDGLSATGLPESSSRASPCSCHDDTSAGRQPGAAVVWHRLRASCRATASGPGDTRFRGVRYHRQHWCCGKPGRRREKRHAHARSWMNASGAASPRCPLPLAALGRRCRLRSDGHAPFDGPAWRMLRNPTSVPASVSPPPRGVGCAADCVRARGHTPSHMPRLSAHLAAAVAGPQRAARHAGVQRREAIVKLSLRRRRLDSKLRGQGAAGPAARPAPV